MEMRSVQVHHKKFEHSAPHDCDLTWRQPSQKRDGSGMEAGTERDKKREQKRENNREISEKLARKIILPMKLFK